MTVDYINNITIQDFNTEIEILNKIIEEQNK